MLFRVYHSMQPFNLFCVIICMKKKIRKIAAWTIVLTTLFSLVRIMISSLIGIFTLKLFGLFVAFAIGIVLLVWAIKEISGDFD